MLHRQPRHCILPPDLLGRLARVNDEAVRTAALDTLQFDHLFRLTRAEWTEAELARRVNECLHDRALHARLAATSARMRSQDGPAKAARLLAGLLDPKVRHG